MGIGGRIGGTLPPHQDGLPGKGPISPIVPTTIFVNSPVKESTIRKIESVRTIIKYYIEHKGDIDLPISDFDGRFSFTKSVIPAGEVKNMQVNALLKIDTGETVPLKDLLEDIKRGG